MTTLEEQVAGEQADHEAKLRAESDPDEDATEREDEEAAGEDELEPVDSEGADGQEDEPETEPAPPSLGLTPEDLRRAERKRDNYRKGMAEILGADMVAHECIVCTGLGYVPELPPAGLVLEVIEGENGLAVQARAGDDPNQYPEAPDKEGCPECDALGFVRTGSRNPNAMVMPCSKCQGNGFIQKIREPAPPLAAVPGAAPLQEVHALTGGAVVDDAWGRPPGHRHWGVPPASIPG